MRPKKREEEKAENNPYKIYQPAPDKQEKNKISLLIKLYKKTNQYNQINL